jgi:O-antigen biosynthesis protein WbqP
MAIARDERDQNLAPIRMQELWIKRTVDLVAVAILAVPATIVLAIAAIIIRLDSSGHALFRQLRVGRNARPFVCYKLRTMREGTPNAASHEVSRHAVTRIGRFLRATKIDELPQLWNVLRGDMSLVGPRPCLPTQIHLVQCRTERGVFRIRPGITGLAQVQGIDMSEPERLADVDAQYVRDASVGLDLKLLLMTLLGRGGGDRVRS